MKYLVILNILITYFPLNCDSSVFTNKSHEQPVDISALLKSFEVGKKQLQMKDKIKNIAVFFNNTRGLYIYNHLEKKKS